MRTPFNTAPAEPRSRWQRLFHRTKRSRTVGDLFMLGVFTLMFGGLGIMLVFVGTRELFVQRRIIATAVPVEATVLSTKVISSRSMDTDRRTLRDNSTTSYLPEVRFAYTFGGVRYESDLLYPTVIHHAYASAEEAAAEIAEYKAGATTMAFADVSHPERGFLRMQKSSGPVWFIVAGCLSFVLLGVVFRFA